MLKIALAQLSYHTGNFQSNTQKMLLAIEKAKAEHADIIVFAELATCGYPARDFLEFSDFVRLSQESVNTLADACRGITAIVGSPIPNPELKGKDLFNAALVLENGVVAASVAKTLLPNYDIFDEYRYFEPNKEFHLVNIKGHSIAITVCEDLWNVDENPMYRMSPMDELMPLQPELIINIAASPYSSKQIQQRKHVLKTNCQRYGLSLVYVNHIGAQTHQVFDGGSMVWNQDAALVEELAYFEEDFRVVDFKSEQGKLIPLGSAKTNSQAPSKYEGMEAALTLGIRQYFQKLGFKKAIIGLSGGIDSALVTYLAAKALGPENVQTLLLPSQFSSEHSISDSIQLCKNLGISYEEIPIQEVVNSVENTLKPFFEGTKTDITEENIQSRTRAILLMAMSNKFGYILLNTSNKSELAVGYGTLYGDMCGGLSVIGDVYKTEVYELCRHINRVGELIPENILTKEPSAELRPDQKDSDSLPPYPLLDAILHAYIEEHLGPSEIVSRGYDEALVKRILRMVNMNEWKRWQAPPTIRVSTRAFGPGRRVPISGKYLG